MKVYLIYSVKDKNRKWMEKLCQAIEKAGITLYALDWELNAGKKMLRRVKKAIKDSRCVVGVLTNNTNRNPYVWQEFGLAKAYEKPIIPLIAASGVDTIGKLLIEHQVGRKFIELNTRAPATAISQTIAALRRRLSPSQRRSLKAQKIASHIKKSASQSLLELRSKKG